MYTDATGASMPLVEADVLIITPYNAQVRALSEALPGFRIGTVDKFQGQEAPISIYSMATSSLEEAPHGMEFLYSLNRLNVATSRAQCVALDGGQPQAAPGALPHPAPDAPRQCPGTPRGDGCRFSIGQLMWRQRRCSRSQAFVAAISYCFVSFDQIGSSLSIAPGECRAYRPANLRTQRRTRPLSFARRPVTMRNDGLHCPRQ